MKNDPKSAEYLKENIQQSSILTLSTNNNNITNQVPIRNSYSIESEESSSNNENINTEIRFNNPNEEIIQGERAYRINGPIFIIKFYPNKIACILVIILNLIPGGLGTMILGVNQKSSKYIFGGIIHFLLIDFSAVLGILLLKKQQWFNKEYKRLLPIYLINISIFFYFISVYIAFINNFIFINSKRIRKYHKKEVGIFILLLNLFIPGLGTLMIQSIVPDQCMMKARRTLTGIGQLAMFIILLLFFSGISKMNDNLLLFIFLAIVEYLYTIGTSICFLRNIIITENVINEIEV